MLCVGPCQAGHWRPAASALQNCVCESLCGRAPELCCGHYGFRRAAPCGPDGLQIAVCQPGAGWRTVCAGGRDSRADAGRGAALWVAGRRTVCRTLRAERSWPCRRLDHAAGGIDLSRRHVHGVKTRHKEGDEMTKPQAPSQTWNAAEYARNGRFVADLAGGVFDLLDAKLGEHILDLGCGDGALTARIAAAGAVVTGVDASPDMVRGAQALGVHAMQMSAEALNFDGEFDAVFSNAALH